MFDETLLESSPSRVSVLKGKHWLISLAIGVVVFLALFFLLPVLAFGAETKVVAAQAGIVASADHRILAHVVLRDGGCAASELFCYLLVHRLCYPRARVIFI